MLRKVIKFAALLLIGALIGVLLHDYWWRCSSSGLSKDVALAIANKKLSTQEKKFGTKEFTLTSAQQEGSDWMFTYEVKDCTLDIIITKCGEADVGGLTRGCF